MRRTAIELRFDAATDSCFRAIALDLHGGRPVTRPHVTLAVLHDADDDAAVAAADRLADRFHRPIATRVAGVGTFPGAAVVYAAPTPSAESLALHAALHADLASRAIATWDLYRPDAWLPHATLATDVPDAAIGDVVAQVRTRVDVFGPATFDAIAVVALEDGRELARFGPRPAWPTLDVRPGLRLRPVAIDDATALFALTDGCRADLREWLPWVDATRSPADTRAFLARVVAAGRANAVWAIEADGTIAGVVGFNWIDRANGAAGIGYWLAAGHQGRGIMTACVERLTRFAFDEMGLRRVSIAAATGNARSRAVAERAGFIAEGTLRDAERIGDRVVDHVLYARLRDRA